MPLFRISLYERDHIAPSKARDLHQCARSHQADLTAVVHFNDLLEFAYNSGFVVSTYFSRKNIRFSLFFVVTRNKPAFPKVSRDQPRWTLRYVGKHRETMSIQLSYPRHNNAPFSIFLRKLQLRAWYYISSRVSIADSHHNTGRPKCIKVRRYNYYYTRIKISSTVFLLNFLR